MCCNYDTKYGLFAYRDINSMTYMVALFHSNAPGNAILQTYLMITQRSVLSEHCCCSDGFMQFMLFMQLMLHMELMLPIQLKLLMVLKQLMLLMQLMMLVSSC